MTVKERQDQLYNYCDHEFEYEFKKGQYDHSWRGDTWCKKCPWALFSSEATRMRFFGLMRNPNPPSVKKLKPGTRSGDMFMVQL